jgi:hypothetical protein
VKDKFNPLPKLKESSSLACRFRLALASLPPSPATCPSMNSSIYHASRMSNFPVKIENGILFTHIFI